MTLIHRGCWTVTGHLFNLKFPYYLRKNCVAVEHLAIAEVCRCHEHPERRQPVMPAALQVQEAVRFYKSWDRHGALSNFSPHPIDMAGPDGGTTQRWASVEHFYQAHKFVGSPHPEAAALVQVRTVVGRCSTLRMLWLHSKPILSASAVLLVRMLHEQALMVLHTCTRIVHSRNDLEFSDTWP